jgi:hypothetical protein
MRAVGTNAHLKKKYGAGYHIDVLTNAENCDTVKDNIHNLMPGIPIQSFYY